MSGERDLQKLLASMSPVLDPLQYVFATTTEPGNFAHLEPIMRFTEEEGETLILEASAAEARWMRSGFWRRRVQRWHVRASAQMLSLPSTTITYSCRMPAPAMQCERWRRCLPLPDRMICYGLRALVVWKQRKRDLRA